MVFDIVDVLNLDPVEVEFVVVIPDRFVSKYKYNLYNNTKTIIHYNDVTDIYLMPS